MQNESMDAFSELIDSQLESYSKGFDPGEKVSGVILDVGPEFVVVDLNAKREGIIARTEFADEDGVPSVAIGDDVTAYFVTMREGAFLLSTALSGVAAAQELRDAVANNMPVEGMVKAEINGGYEVTVDGRRAFCPYSQIDIRRKEPEEFLGKRLGFLVTEFDEEENNIVLSRRELLERERAEEREALKATLAEGDVREGVVARILDFGVFIDLGGIDGLIPARELAWERNIDPADIVQEGERVTVLVQKVDWEEERISLSLRYAQGNPWDRVAARYPVGTSLRATVTKLASFGAFAELEPGIEGLIHISNLGAGRRLSHAREAVAEDDELDVQVESVDVEQERIGLKLIDVRMRELTAANRVEVGARLTGVVEGHRPFGVFVRLTESRTGLLHISETQLPQGGNALRKLEEAYPAGGEIEVAVKSIEGDRVSLAPAAAWQEQQETEAEVDAMLNRKAPPSAFGSLGEAFEGLNLS
jgi:small subunit ribosomal protein S1